MKIEFNWHIPCAGDGHWMCTRMPERMPYVDSYTLGTAVVAATRSLEVLIAHRPGFINPGVFAQMCSTLDDFSGGRLALNIVTARAPGAMERFGDVPDHDAR